MKLKMRKPLSGEENLDRNLIFFAVGGIDKLKHKVSKSHSRSSFIVIDKFVKNLRL